MISTKWRRARTGAVCLVAGLALLLGGCGGESGDGGNDAAGEAAGSAARVNAVATTGQIGDLVRNVGGDRVRVTALMGPGIDPHLYKASAGDVERLRKADIIFYNGLHLEAKMADVLERLGARQPTVAVAEAIPELRLISSPDFPDAYDPHVWFDLSLWQTALEAVRDALTGLDPDHAETYRANAAAYHEKLAELDDYVREQIARITPARRVLITAHDAFNYYGQAYGLEVRGLQGISTATEAGTGDVQDLAAFIAEHRIPALFVETSVSPKAIEAVRAAVRSRGFEVVLGGEIFSDALGDPGTPAGTYLGMVRHNTDTIVAALMGRVVQGAAAEGTHGK